MDEENEFPTGFSQIVDAASAVTARMNREAAASVWKKLSDRFPKSHEVTLGYLNELFLCENWSDVDSFAKRYPERCDQPEVIARLIDSYLVRLQLAPARRLLARYSKSHGTDERYLLRTYDLECLERRFCSALRTSLQYQNLVPDRRGAVLAARAKCYSEVVKGFRASTLARDYRAYGINLDADSQRLRRLARQIPNGMFCRVPAVKGRYLPDTVNRAITRGAGWKLKGSIGCFLSHISVWEHIANSDLPYGLVLEDDALLIAGLPPSISSLGLSGNVDLLFVNERMSPDPFEFSATFSKWNLADVLDTKQHDWRSPGGDGYVISKSAARKLLKYITDDGMAGDVDWRLLMYGLETAEVKRICATETVKAQAIRFHARQCAKRTPLRAAVLNPPLVRQLSGGSVRVWDNNFPAQQLAQVVAGLTGRVANNTLSG